MTGIEQSSFKSGFAAISGPPNAGKSTLLNRMLGEKISITSEKPQTTRNRIAGVVHRPGAQIVFLDTPGIHRSKKTFNQRIVAVALAAMNDIDVLLMVADAAHPDPESEELILSTLRNKKHAPVILALNKIDLVKKSSLLKLMDDWSKAYCFEAIVPISAAKGTQVDDLLAAMQKLLPDGPPYFPEDMVTDMPERFLASELIREKVFHSTGREVPYATAVTIESYEADAEKDRVLIHATIHVERDSQKGIIIGKQGKMLGAIGEAARKDIGRMLGAKVYLKLFVRIEKNWSRDARAMRRLGY